MSQPRTTTVYYVGSDDLKVVLARLIRKSQPFICEARKEGKTVKFCLVHQETEYRWVQTNKTEKTFSSFESLENGLLKLLPRSEDLQLLDVRMLFVQRDIELCH